MCVKQWALGLDRQNSLNDGYCYSEKGSGNPLFNNEANETQRLSNAARYARRRANPIFWCLCEDHRER